MQPNLPAFTSPSEILLAANERILEIFPEANSGILCTCPEEDITIVSRPPDAYPDASNAQADSQNDVVNIQDEDYWSLVFALEGEAELLAFTKDTPIPTHIAPDTLTLFHSHNGYGSCSLMKKIQANLVSINLKREHLKHFLEIDDERSLDNFMCAYGSTQLNIAQKSILHQIFNSTKKGMACSLYFQAKLMELLSDFIEPVKLEIHGCCKKHEHCLSCEEIHCIKSAKHILENNMLAPPCLSKLSQLVGLNVNKLKRGFRDVYNTTPYAFLREARMIKSGNLLSNKDMSVSQVAWEVGYNSLGHFAEAFQVHYGVKPKAFQMSKSKKTTSKLSIA